MAQSAEDLFDISPQGFKTIPGSGSITNADPSSPKLSTSLPNASYLGVFDEKQSSGNNLMDEVGSSVNSLEADLIRKSSERKFRRRRKPGQRSISFSVGENTCSSPKIDIRSKLERSRQSARECRARKKIRYQYLDDLILEREKVNSRLREELLRYQGWCHSLDQGEIPEGLTEALSDLKLPSWNSAR